MPSVFLSYRRVDGDYALLLHAWLTERFGAEEVFWDRDDIEAGQDFRRVLSQQLRDCRALIALVGPGWSASEWVQKEIATALRRKILVLPVLVGAAPNLDEDGLPKAIRAIASLQSLQTADLRFRAQLLDALARVMPAPARRGASRASGSSGSPARDARTGRLAALLLEQSDRLQENALDLLLRGDLDAALEVLNKVFELLMALLDFHPADAWLEVRLGFLYKDLAQAAQGTSPAHQRRYLENGRHLFEALVKRRMDGLLLANAWNGLGNILLLSGEVEQAIEHIEHALELLPDYGYAWADLFDAHDAAGERGRRNLKAMRNALRQLKATGQGDARLEAAAARNAARLRELEARR